MLLGTCGVVAFPAYAKDAEGCEGLSDYSQDMLSAGRDYVDNLKDDGIPTSRDPLSYSSEDWTQLAKRAAEFEKAIKEIDPPSFAEDWHQSQIEHMGLVEQVAKAAAEEGVMAVLAFTEALDNDEAARKAALADVSASCSEFSAFHSEWDLIDGEAEGTPTPDESTAGEIPFGETGNVADQWDVQVLDVFLDAHDIDPSDEFFSNWIDTYPLPEGQQYFALRLKITNNGPKAGKPAFDLSYAVLSESEFEYTGTFACGNIPGGLDFSQQMDVGETIEANLCWVVRTEHIPTLRLRIEPGGFSFDESKQVWFSLAPTG